MSIDQKFLGFISGCKLFQGVPREDLEHLVPLVQRVFYPKDTTVIEEGERGRHLYIIVSGRVVIEKKLDDLGNRCALASLGEGEWFGEMAFLGEGFRTATVKTLMDTEVATLTLSDIDKIAHQGGSLALFAKNLLEKISDSLKETSNLAVKSLGSELKISKASEQMEHFIIHLFILLSLFFYAFKISTLIPDPTTALVLPSILIVCLGLSSALLVHQSPYPKEFFGLSWKNGGKNIVESILLSIPILLVMTLIKWFLIRSVPDFAHLELFNYTGNDTVFALIYVLLVPIQEFIARGCLQSLLENFFRSPNRVFLGILTSNLLFGLFHGFKTFSFILGAFILGNFWGWLYARQRSIVGPCASHIFIGGCTFTILDYQHLLIY